VKAASEAPSSIFIVEGKNVKFACLKTSEDETPKADAKKKKKKKHDDFVVATTKGAAAAVERTEEAMDGGKCAPASDVAAAQAWRGSAAGKLEVNFHIFPFMGLGILSVKLFLISKRQLATKSKRNKQDFCSS
jgi:hypothetical protein